MKIARRITAIALASVGSLVLVLALVVRVAYATVFDTDTYVKTMVEIGKVSSMQSEVASDVTDAIVNSAQLDSPQMTAFFKKTGVNQAEFRDTAARVINKSVLAFIESDVFITIWGDLNRAAHKDLMKLVNSDSTVIKDFVVDIGPLVKVAAASLQDPDNKISKVIPLKDFIPEDGTFSTKLIQASGVEDLRKAVSDAHTLRNLIMLTAVVFIGLAWLVFGRTRGAHRMVGIALAGTGVFTLILRGIGKKIVEGIVGADAQPSADAIYSVTLSPLTQYALLALLLGTLTIGATFYRRNASV